MTYDELELEAMIQELYELIENTKNFTDGDAEEAYEHLNQYSPISRKRFVNLYSV
ncbi:MAG: hypothetical protein ACOCMY_04645 [Campylobacter hyointestinalis]